MKVKTLIIQFLIFVITFFALWTLLDYVFSLVANEAFEFNWSQPLIAGCISGVLYTIGFHWYFKD